MEARTTMSRAMSPSSVVTNPTVTRTRTLSLPSTRVSGLIQNDRRSAGLPRMLRETVMRFWEISTIGPENVSSYFGSVFCAGCVGGVLPSCGMGAAQRMTASASRLGMESRTI